MDVMEAARKAEADGRRIIHMEVGQPGTGAPPSACDAVHDALDHDALGYTVALGLPALRERIAALYKDWYGIDLDAERVVVTAGASGGFILAFNALFDTGQRVGIGAPGYPSYRQILKSLGIVPVDIPTRAENRFQPVPADLAGLDGMLVASPANPTGTMLLTSELRALIRAAEAAQVPFISDEIYHGITYDQRAVSALEISDDVYVINSFSKYFSMTGWRIGWMVVPPDHVRIVERLAQNMFICPSHASQVAALAAFDNRDILEAHVDVYRKNRSLMIEGLKEAGFTDIAPPDGAFYIYADISEFSNDSLQFCKEVLDQAGVAITPGLDFDAERGAQTVRFSYAQSTDDIREGIERLTKFMAQRG
jgi:aspartate/methionine/tyrosine aminotransferase